MTTPKSLLSLAILAATSQAAFADLVTNGSFESGNASNSGNYIFDGNGADVVHPGDSTTIVGWTEINGDLAVINNTSFGIIPEDGTISLDLTSYNDGRAPYGGVSQDIATQVGATYHLSFWVGSFAEGTTKINAFAGTDVTTGASSFPLVQPPQSIYWVENHFDFLATAGTTNISLIGDQASGGGTYIGLDNVSVTFVRGPAGDGVPLPSTACGGIALLTVIGATKLSRKSRAQA